MIKESEACKKACPFDRATNDTCVGSHCMAWRWADINTLGFSAETTFGAFGLERYHSAESARAVSSAIIGSQPPESVQIHDNVFEQLRLKPGDRSMLVITGVRAHGNGITISFRLKSPTHGYCGMVVHPPAKIQE